MRITISLFVLISVLLITVDAQRARGRGKGRGRNSKQRNSCHFREIDNCIAKLEKYSNNTVSSSLISSSSGLDEICTTSFEVTGCFQTFLTRCATPLQREIADIVIEQFSKAIDKFCKPGPDRDAFLANSPCIDKEVLGRQKYRERCVQPFLASVDQISGLKSLDDRVDTVCCSYVRWENCLFDMTSRKCGNQGNQAIVNFVKKAFGGISNIICTQEMFPTESNRCQALFAPPGSTPKAQLSTNPVTKYLTQYFGFLFS